MIQKHLTVVAFAGPSGSGKSELVHRLLDQYPDNVTKWKQATTRPKRGPDDDYVFLTKSMYDVVRYTLTCRTEFNGNFYGTFPEPVSDDVAVLTIADAKGMADLVNDIAEHNRRVLDGHTGKLGEHPVKLVKVLMHYELTDDEIRARGADRNGTRDAAFLLAEIEALRESAEFDHVLDSSGGQWASAEAFFTEVIWPAICTPMADERAESVRATVNEQLSRIAAGVGASNDISVLRSVMGALLSAEDCLAAVPAAAAAADPVDAVLEGVLEDPDDVYSRSLAQAEAAEAAEDGDVQYATDYLNDRIPSAAPAPEIVPEPEPEIVPEPEPEIVPEPEITPEPEPEPAAAPRAYAEIFAACDFTEWMLEHTIGIEAFENETMFKTIFAQYVSSNGGDPNNIAVSSQSTRDGRGGRVVEYTAVLPGGGTYAVEFNERIKQVTFYGPR